jgi:hypothetical protein
MPSVHDIAAFPQALRQEDFHVLGIGKRHGVQVRIQPRHKALAATPDDARRFDPLFMILEALFRRESRHADVVRRFAVALRIAQEDDVDVVMVL